MPVETWKKLLEVAKEVDERIKFLEDNPDCH